jgi:HSP20 family molecular chaperone IbpA
MENRDTNAGAMTRRPQGGLARPASRYNPLYEMQEQMRRMDALFNRVFGFEPFPATFRNEFQQLQQLQEAEPDVDIYESNTEYTLHAALPGIDPQDIQLEATEDSIVLSAQRRSPFDQTQGQQTQGRQTQGQGANEPQNITGQSGAQTAGSQSAGMQTSGSQPGQMANQSDAQSGQQGGTNAMGGVGSQEPASGSQQSTQPHTQHRQSRHSAQTRIRLVYTFPTPIESEAVSATFRNGMLELHLPKQRPASARAVPISVQAGGATQTIGGQSNQQIGAAQSTSAGSNEGRPASKMGSNYTPSPGEDHTAQVQSIGARTDHEPGRQESPIAGGQTNPMGTGNAATTGAPADAKRS